MSVRHKEHSIKNLKSWENAVELKQELQDLKEKLEVQDLQNKLALVEMFELVVKGEE